MKIILLAAAALSLAATAAHAAPTHRSTGEIMAQIRDPHGRLIVVAHRGCHEPAPLHGFGAAPENSVQALEKCAAMGVDMMETDVLESKDGYLVIMHDETVDRTTTGTGKVADLTLAQIKSLRLRQDEGGSDAAATDQFVLTLDEMLALAKDRITLNLDVKDAIYPQVIAAVRKAGAQNRVTLKTRVGVGSQPLAPMAPYDEVPFLVIPKDGDDSGKSIPDMIAAQMSGKIKPVGIELPYRLPREALPAIVKRAQSLGVRLWVNMLDGNFVLGAGSDRDALRAPDAVWGSLVREGVSMLLTDEPEAMLAMRDASGRR
ncbi:glycerophosphodiester phosphodiesterase family protein [Novosphingobium aerophilum]|uniref:glycerophosphodiester phosphodiesterase family protein n=1 Tax=Novosphingobium TaxID=165696 RepID=UPI002D767D00|nr:glycerophosphodiester phosphodiesterase family protein [Novosphingobium sp. RL4]WRT91659.1 glycerophosphodiester phosphodiesterase family protein [Novosphingobium sp. RL4]